MEGDLTQSKCTSADYIIGEYMFILILFYLYFMSNICVSVAAMTGDFPRINKRPILSYIPCVHYKVCTTKCAQENYNIRYTVRTKCLLHNLK